MVRVGLTYALGLMSLPNLLLAEPSKVSLDQGPSVAWQLIRNGEPYAINGAGGFTNLKLLRDLGGNTIRTWGVGQLGLTESGKLLLDECNELGLTALVGLWVNHPRHGHDYDDEAMLQAQRDRIRSAVQKYRDHPALLMWGLGNEMEGDGDDPRVWQELEVLARIIKEEDPEHPVCTVLAGSYNNKVAKMLEHYTSLDVLGINIYAGAETVPASLADQGWDRPYLLTEFGPVGHWEVPMTDWEAPLEPTSVEKSESYAAAHTVQMEAAPGRCLGTFCFIWGQKQETTATWFSMFLPTGEKTPVVDTMSRIWTGQEPTNRSPFVSSLRSDLREVVVAPSSLWQVSAEVLDPDGDPLDFEWQIVAETNDRKFGGDAESAPPTIPDCVMENHGSHAQIRVPSAPGPYRVFLYVRDGKGGGASGNFPFLVQ